LTQGGRRNRREKKGPTGDTCRRRRAHEAGGAKKTRLGIPTILFVFRRPQKAANLGDRSENGAADGQGKGGGDRRRGRGGGEGGRDSTEDNPLGYGLVDEAIDEKKRGRRDGRGKKKKRKERRRKASSKGVGSWPLQKKNPTRKGKKKKGKKPSPKKGGVLRDPQKKKKKKNKQQEWGGTSGPNQNVRKFCRKKKKMSPKGKAQSPKLSKRKESRLS